MENYKKKIAGLLKESILCFADVEKCDGVGPSLESAPNCKADFLKKNKNHDITPVVTEDT